MQSPESSWTAADRCRRCRCWRSVCSAAVPALVDGAGRPTGHHHADSVRAVRSERALVQRASGPDEGAGIRAGQSSASSCRASIAGWPWPPRTAGWNIGSPSPTTTPASMIEQVQLFLAAKVGGVVAAPVDPASLSRSLQEIIWAGGYVGTVVPPPATSLLNAPQYLTGKTLGDAAAAYIKDHAWAARPRSCCSPTTASSFSRRASSPCATR